MNWRIFDFLRKNKSTSTSETTDVEAQEEESMSDTYFTAEIHFKDGEILFVTARKISGGDTYTRFSEHGGDDYFLEAMDEQIKYTIYEEDLIVTRNTKFGVEKIKSSTKSSKPKKTSLEPKDRLKSID